MNKIIHRFGMFFMSILFLVILHLINEKMTNINVMLSKNMADILKSTITFTSIISGFSGSLIGQLIGSKNNKNIFVIWYFEKIDRKTFVYNVLFGTISAFSLIGCSIILLSYDIMNDFNKTVFTHLWTLSLFSFVLYQIKIYYLCLDLLLYVPKDIPKYNQTNNIDSEEKQKIFKSMKDKQSESSPKVKTINANSLIKKH